MQDILHLLDHDFDVLRHGYQDGLTALWHTSVMRNAAADCLAAKCEIESLRAQLEAARDYVNRAIHSYVGDPADNQFQRGHLAALEVVRDEAFSALRADKQ